MIKKVILAVCIVILVCSAAVFASENNVDFYVADIDEHEIIIYGTVPVDGSGDWLTISLLNPGFTADNADDVDADVALNSFKRLTVTEEEGVGAFSVKLRIRNAQTGTYTALVRTNAMEEPETLSIDYYIGDAMLTLCGNIAAALEKGDGEELAKHFTEDVLRLIGIRKTYLGNISAAEICSMIEGVPMENVGADIKSTKYAIEEIVILKMVKDEELNGLVTAALTDEQAMDVLSGGNGAAPAFKVLAKSDEKIAMEVLEDISGKTYAARTEFDKALNVSVLNNAIANAENYVVVRDIMNDFYELFETDFSKEYEDLSKTQKAKAESELQKYIKNNEVKKVDDVAKKFLSIIEDITEDSKASSGSGSGSGGGGGGSRVNVSSDIVKDVNAVDSNVGKMPFVDIGHVQWAQESIIALEKAGVVSGRSKMQFEPDATVTREEFVKMAVIALKIEAEAATEITFADVLDTDWFYPYVSEAYSCGVINGVNDVFFGTGLEITREEMATILYRATLAEKTDAENVNLSFADKDGISEYAREAVAVLSDMGIINGKGNGRFEPKASATRAEAAKVIYMIMQKLSK